MMSPQGPLLQIVPRASPEWYLKVEENRAGPYSGDQILAFLEAGKIQPQHLVTSESISSGGQAQWITVEELRQAYSRLPRESHATPPRLTVVPPFDPDASRDLFETLQAAREKKGTTQFTPARSSEGAYT